ncbi:MAG: hypothetical protein KY476_22205 [Planctomycetes bacterium]|nr:hypothetical protein [Planctomycetota bacterium]
MTRRPPRLLVLCFPTWGRGNQLHRTGRGDAVVLAPDEFLRLLLEAGWTMDVVSLAGRSELPLYRSRLPLKAITDVDFDSYDLYWHMFRDPTQPEVLQMLSQLKLDDGGRPMINRAEKLCDHHKGRYAPLLAERGLGPEIIDDVGGIDASTWHQAGSVRISPDRRFIQTHKYNNNHGDYPERAPERIVTRFVENEHDGLWSIVRFGVAFGEGFRGFRYWGRSPFVKSGTAERWEEYAVPERLRAPLAAVLDELGCDVCHVEAVPLGESLSVFDINPYPTAEGRTLSQVSAEVVRVLRSRFEPPGWADDSAIRQSSADQ